MSLQQLFSPSEWRILQFGVLDVFMMVSQIDGKTGMDAAEKEEFFYILKHPDFSDDPLLRTLLASFANAPKDILENYWVQYKFDLDYFESSFTKIRSIIDDKLNKAAAASFKDAMTMQLGYAIANASGEGMDGLGKVDENELLAIATITKWLKK
jgi:hypothetical protein